MFNLNSRQLFAAKINRSEADVPHRFQRNQSLCIRTFFLTYMAGLLVKWMTAQGCQHLFCLRFGHKQRFR